EPVSLSSAGGDGQARRQAPLDWLKQHLDQFRQAPFWQTGVDAARLDRFFAWGRVIDTRFLNDRTTIILGDQPTVGGVQFQGGRMAGEEAFRGWGDGPVPAALALPAGVPRVYRARGGEHMLLPATLSVIAAVHQVLTGRKPRLEAAGLGAGAAGGADVP